MDVSNTMTMDINENTDLGTPEYAQASTAKRDAAVKVVSAVPKDATGMYKVVIIAKLSRYDHLKKAMNDLGVTGMTCTQVMGCGIQKGSGERYRGAEVDATLLPKIKVEVVVSKIPVDSVVAAAKRHFIPDISEMEKSSYTMWQRLSRFVPVRKIWKPYRC